MIRDPRKLVYNENEKALKVREVGRGHILELGELIKMIYFKGTLCKFQ